MRGLKVRWSVGRLQPSGSQLVRLQSFRLKGARHQGGLLTLAGALGVWLCTVASSPPALSAPLTPAGAPQMLPGSALPGLTAEEQQSFELGRTAFERVRGIESGLGPVFNDFACNRCHNKRGVGGAGIQSAVLAGRLDERGFDALVARGGPVLASNTVMQEPAADRQRLIPGCRLARDGEPVPAEANVVSRRRTTPLFGLGLVDATPDATFVALAKRQPAKIRGRVAWVQNLATGERSVGKFGWKAQAPSLHQFSGQALLMELGVTSPQFPIEQAPFGDAGLLAACDVRPEPEDDGGDVARMTDFMRLLAPVPPLESSAEVRAGDVAFSRLGCDGCHVRRLTSGASPVAALSEKAYAPFSDFLLHDMGELGDGVAEGDALPREMRTAPLWGGRLSGSRRLLHDGRARSFEEAIEQHGGQGAASRELYRASSPSERERLAAFLSAL
jgi:CxxC motif-containing protein (DUF1111 family)